MRKVKIEIFEGGQFAVSSGVSVTINKKPPVKTVEMELPELEADVLIDVPQAFLYFDKKEKKLKVKNVV